MAAINNKYSHIEILLKHGSDPNISDGFSQFYHIAKKLNIDPIYGMYFIL